MFSAEIDQVDQKHDGLVLDGAGRHVGSIRVSYTPEGLAKLDAFLSQITGQQSKEQMACRMETTHRLLSAFLLEQGLPVDLVSPVNPRTGDRRHSAFGANTNAIGASLLAKTGRTDFAELRRLTRLTPDSEKVAECKALTCDQDRLIQMQTRLVNQFTACLKDSSPVALHLFTGTFQPRSTLLSLQGSPSPEKLMEASRDQIAQTL